MSVSACLGEQEFWTGAMPNPIGKKNHVEVIVIHCYKG